MARVSAGSIPVGLPKAGPTAVPFTGPVAQLDWSARLRIGRAQVRILPGSLDVIFRDSTSILGAMFWRFRMPPFQGGGVRFPVALLWSCGRAARQRVAGPLTPVRRACGDVSERPGSGLQSRPRGFDSRRPLQFRVRARGWVMEIVRDVVDYG